MAAAVIIHQARGLLKTTRPSFLGPRLGLQAASAAVRHLAQPTGACWRTTIHYSRLYYSSRWPPSDQNDSRPSFAYGGNFFEIRPSYERRNWKWSQAAWAWAWLTEWLTDWVTDWLSDWLTWLRCRSEHGNLTGAMSPSIFLDLGYSLWNFALLQSEPRQFEIHTHFLFKREVLCSKMRVAPEMHCRGSF